MIEESKVQETMGNAAAKGLEYGVEFYLRASDKLGQLNESENV